MIKTDGGGATLASVVFFKIQEFARRPVIEQMRLRAQLEAVIAVTTAKLDPSGWLVLEASDGAAIVVLRDPKGALRAADRALAAAAAGLPLSAGINHGAVQLSGGGKGEEGMIGDGIAVAANIAEFAASSKLLVSRAFHDALADASPGEEACLVPAGVLTDPGLRSHELFSPDQSLTRSRSVRFYVLSALAAAGLIAGSIAIRISADGQEKFFADVQAKSAAYVAGLLGKLKFWEPPQAALPLPLPPPPAGKGKTSRDKSRG